MAEPRSTAQEAGDPSTSPERLIELTEKHPQLHRLLVLNPATPEVARQWILATNTWAQRAYAEQQANAASAPEQDPEPDSARDPEEPDPQSPEARRHPAISATAPAWAEIPEEPVWGDLRSPNEDAGSTAAGERTAEHDTVTAAADETPGEAPAPVAGDTATASPGTGVRITSPHAVVPLGPAPTAAAFPWDGAPSQAAPAPLPDLTAAGAPAGAGHGTPFLDGAAGPSESPADDERSRRRIWFACGGCLLLALVLILASVFLGRALFGGDDETTGQPPASETATEEPTQEPTQEETTPADPVSPAPDGAQEMTELSSPTGNITCLLEEDSVACSIIDRDFSDAGLEDCEAGPFSLQVADGEAAPACGSSFLSDAATTLEYDRSATYGDMACTSRFDGMTCWNTMTGKGFSVNRGEYATF